MSQHSDIAKDIVIDPASPTPDRMEQHHRQQLSAMMDGALAPDQARFLLRRLQHDAELGACWERWQVYGDAMRGHGHALLPVDFAERVGRALHDEPQPQAVAVSAPRRGRALRWAGGGALAASVALVALIGLRPESAGLPAADMALPAAQTETAQPMPVADAHGAPGQPAVPNLPAAAVAVAAAATVASAPVARERSQPRAARVAAPAAVREEQRVAGNAGGDQPAPMTVALAAQADVPLQSAMQAAAQAQAHDPFAAPPAGSARPWPRTVLPGISQGSFNAAYNGAVFAPSQAAMPVARPQPVEPAAAPENGH